MSSKPEHLTKRRLSGVQKERGPNEWVCLSCGTSITKNPNTGKEYGHGPDCNRQVDDELRKMASEGENDVIQNQAKHPEETRECAFCDETFTCKKTSPKKYCSVGCANKANSEDRVAVTCQNCGHSEVVSRCRGQGYVYCSNWCQRDYHDTPQPVNAEKPDHIA